MAGKIERLSRPWQERSGVLKIDKKLKEIDPSCTTTVSTVLKKINNLRSSFRKEAKKVKDSMRTGSGADEVYHPKLWYYDLLKFVEDQEVSRNSRSNISDDEDSENEDESQAETLNTDAHSPQTEPETQDSTEKTSSVASGSQFRHRPTPKSQKPDDQTQLTKELLATVNNHFKRPRTADDRFDIVGKNVAMKLRDLTNDQRRLAEKFINDVLFEAEGGTLTPHHKLTYQPPLSNRYHSSSTYSSLPSFQLSATPTPPQQLLLLNSPTSNEYYSNHLSSSNPSRPSSQSSAISSPSQQLLLQNSEASIEHHSQNNMFFPQTESVQEREPSASPRQYQTAGSLLASFTYADNN
ncbi:unnamed protein product [Acanthoscelides obtectus]|uniref:MADF domain-containing protein n=1 Tax=Acanthoscelides obtectus TaxID=200917 RepID=A0A9P0NWE1_ACAOB|nr:unnamed protein product [Acanthoscelides obtectus]CAK1672812.1 hypothetical protein AOBTE_LOCUS29103 [Acanthoscelides obtectus]